jgi:ABC-type glutathione transport system ATPase component
MLYLLRKNHGTTVMIISHDRDLMADICSRMVLLKDGVIAES